MIIAPSVLSLDYTKFNEQVDILNRNVEWLHFDVMDGHFVPNLTFGPDILNAFRRSSSLFMDCHLMISNPDKYVKDFVKAGADQITFHLEALSSNDEVIYLIDYIKSFYLKVGISIKPNTPWDSLLPFLDKIDTVLVMSVEPGFGGQSFMESANGKIKELKHYRDLHNLKYLIEVDGGINEKTAKSVKNCGCDVIVAGSFIFKGDMINNINILRNV